jgi:hypothetical protein
LQQGAVAEARQQFRQALQHHHAARVIGDIADCLVGLAAVAQVTGDLERAVYLLGAADQLHALVDVSGAYTSPALQHEAERLTADLRRQVPPALWGQAWSAGAQLTVDEAVAAALRE